MQCVCWSYTVAVSWTLKTHLLLLSTPGSLVILGGMDIITNNDDLAHYRCLLLVCTPVMSICISAEVCTVIPEPVYAEITTQQNCSSTLQRCIFITEPSKHIQSPSHCMTPPPSYQDYVVVVVVMPRLSPHQCVSVLLPAVTTLRPRAVLEKNSLWHKE